MCVRVHHQVGYLLLFVVRHFLKLDPTYIFHKDVPLLKLADNGKDAYPWFKVKLKRPSWRNVNNNVTDG